MGGGAAELELPVVRVELVCDVALDKTAELAVKVEAELGLLLDADAGPSVGEADEDNMLVELGALLIGVTDETTAVEDGLDAPTPVLLACAVIEPPVFRQSAPTPLPAKNKPIKVVGSASVP